MKNKKRSPLSLSDEEIIDRLRINDEKVVEEIYEIAKGQLSNEVERRSDIDTKANNLAGMIGVYLSVLFGLKGLQSNPVLVGTEIGMTLFLYIAVCVLSAIALMFSLLAARARSDLKTISEADVFKTEEIDEGILVYKRYMAAHYWFVYRNNYAISERKGAHLKKAYLFFFLAVFLSTSLTIINAWKAHEGKIMVEQNTNSSNKSKPKPTSTPSGGEKLTEGKN